MVKYFAQIKIYLDRSRGYVSLIQSLMVAGMFIKIFKLNDFWIAVFIPLFALVAIFAGYLDTKFGVRSEEMRNNSMMNPVDKEILTKIRRIHSIIVLEKYMKGK
jgi:predicted membrane protein